MKASQLKWSYLVLALLAVLLFWPSSKVSVETIVTKSANRILPIQGIPGQTNGTGVLVALPSGMTGLLTNEHVCTGVTEAFGRQSTIYKEEVLADLIKVRASEKDDLCIYLSPTMIHDKGYTVKEPDTYTTGQAMTIVGFPLGGPLAPQSGFYITQMIVHIGARVNSPEECKSGNVEATPFALYCLTAELLNAMTNITYPGNSGSPVFDEEGRLVGIVNSGSSETHQGNFISGSVVKEFLKGL